MNILKLPAKITVSDYQYELPDARIAKYPLPDRDRSKLLVYNESKGITDNYFQNVGEFLPRGTLLVFNNTRVIYARLLFRKQTGAVIELFCLKPVQPADYELAFQSHSSCIWECIVGNVKRWKSGTLTKELLIKEQRMTLTAMKQLKSGEDGSWNIRFSWDNSNITFGDILQVAGQIPIPPYLNRTAEESDLNRYQTVYSKTDGSVAAPTAGLHFTSRVFESIKKHGIKTAEITLHVGAGTFQPVKTDDILNHPMHEEDAIVTKDVIDRLIKNLNNIVAVGTTSLRTLESLYWIGVKIGMGHQPENDKLCLGQWECYDLQEHFPVKDTFVMIKDYLLKHNMTYLKFSTKIIIVPGYQFRVVTRGIITNFHQPGSTLLLLIAAYTGNAWKEIYEYALNHDFRFLSYGDSSLLLKG